MEGEEGAAADAGPAGVDVTLTGAEGLKRTAKTDAEGTSERHGGPDTSSRIMWSGAGCVICFQGTTV